MFPLVCEEYPKALLVGREGDLLKLVGFWFIDPPEGIMLWAASEGATDEVGLSSMTIPNNAVASPNMLAAKETLFAPLEMATETKLLVSWDTSLTTSPPVCTASRAVFAPLTIGVLMTGGLSIPLSRGDLLDLAMD